MKIRECIKYKFLPMLLFVLVLVCFNVPIAPVEFCCLSLLILTSCISSVESLSSLLVLLLSFFLDVCFSCAVLHSDRRLFILFRKEDL